MSTSDPAQAAPAQLAPAHRPAAAPTARDYDTSVYAFLRGVPSLEETGDNWKGWKFRILRAAATGGVSGHFDGTSIRPATDQAAQAVWDHDDARAMNYLVARLSDTLAGQLHGLTTSDAWDWLCRRFEISNRQSIQSILSALRSLRAKNLDGVGKFLDDHEEILSRAREVDFSLVRDIAATATPAQRSEASNLHYVYSDFILEGLPPSADWKAWAAVYRTSETSTFSPREILDKIRAEYNRLRANQTASTGGLLLANNHHGDTSMTAAITRTSGRNGGNQQGSSRKKCRFCKRDLPNHTPGKCWKNPKNPDNRLGNSGSSASGNSNQKSSSSSSNDKKDGSKTVSFAAATVAASLEEIAEDDPLFPTEWYLDTCATSHIVADRSKFVTYERTSIPVSTAAGPSLTGIGRGNVEIEVKTRDGNHVVALLEAVHVPDSAFNLVSATRFTKAGFAVAFDGNGHFSVISDGHVVLEGSIGRVGLPQIAVVDPTLVVLATPQEERLDLVDRTHLQHGHPSKAAMRDMLRLGELKGFTTSDLDSYFNKSCTVCRAAKMTKASFPIIERQATKPLQRLHSDLAGPFPFSSFGGAKYFVIVRDEASGWIDGEPLRDKTEVPEAFKKVFFRMRAEFESSKVGISESTTLQTDNGTEYSSRTFATFLAEQGITRRLLIPYTPQQNGLSERSVRTVKEKITTCLIQARLPKAYWAEMFYYALFVIDNLPYSPNGGETPYHFLHHRHNPFFSGAVVPVIGQEVWVHDPDAGVFDEKARRAIFLGVGVFRGTKGFRVQDVDDKGSARMFWSRNVQSSPGDLNRRSDFDDEDDFSWVEEEGEEDLQDVEEEAPTPAPSRVLLPSPPVSEPQPQVAPRAPLVEQDEPRRGTRERKQADWKTRHWDYRAGAVIVAVNIADEPQDSGDAAIFAAPVAAASKEAFSHAGRPTPQQPASTKDALSSIYSTEWRKGMDEEWDGFLKQDVVGDLVPRSEGMKVLGTRWHHTARVFPEEEKAQLKSRLVVQGVKTIPFLSSFGPTFTPLPRWDIVAIFFVLTTRLKLPVFITDFAKAYLGAKVATSGEPVFVKQPPGYEVPGREDEVYELRRAAYGLPQSGRAFHLRVKAKLNELNFVSISDDITLYIGRRAGDYVLFILYVDDGLIAGKKDLVEDVVGELQEEFDVTFKGSVHGRTFLGCDIEYDHYKGLVVVKVTSQIRKALKMHGFEDVKPVHMPIQPGIVYKTNTGAPVRTREYLSAVGSLLFIATTRPDIQFAVGVASRFSTNPGQKHWDLVKRIFAYLKATAEVALSLSTGQSSGGGLTAYVDADHAGDVESRRSTTGVVVQLDGSTIHTVSRRQQSVQLSTFQAELGAISVALTELEWYSSIISSLPIGNDAPLRILNDNLSSVKALLSPTYTEEKKQHDVKIKFVREQIEREFVELKWIPGADNVADLLTKALPARQVRELGSRIGLVNWPSEDTWGAR
ncbi:hypothetical protein JCM8202_002088 [Rhodotorula sphaerocarpa]